VNPKNNFMKDYLNYIENGGKLTLETKEILFKESYEDFFISHYEKDEDNFAEDFSDDFVEEYSNYIEHRNGSQVLFSSDGLDIQSIKESFKNKKMGVIYYPIISLKEDETIKYQFTREVMIEKGKEIAVMFKQELNISDYDFEWICAYHEKPEEKRNESAGTMPHLHFMIYSGAQSNGYHNLSVIEKLRKKSIDIFYREHKQELIEMREKTLHEIKSFLSDEDFIKELRPNLDQLYSVLADITKGRGKIQYKALETNKNILMYIQKALMSNMDLSLEQLNFLEKNNIQSSIASIELQIEKYDKLFSQIEFIIHEVILKSESYEKQFKDYINLSIDLRSYYGDGEHKTKLLEEDKKKIFDRLKNSVLRVSVSNYLEAQNRIHINERKFLDTLFNGFPLLKLNTSISTEVCKKISKVLFVLGYNQEQIFSTLDQFIQEKGHSKYINRELQQHIKKLNSEKDEIHNKGIAYLLTKEELKDLSIILDKTKLNNYSAFYRDKRESFVNNQISELKSEIKTNYSNAIYDLFLSVPSDHWDLIEAQSQGRRESEIEDLKREHINKLRLMHGRDYRI
jgi:hypothetical protein